MTSKEALGIVDLALAQATNLPVSYMAVSKAIQILRVAIEREEVAQQDKSNESSMLNESGEGHRPDNQGE